MGPNSEADLTFCHGSWSPHRALVVVMLINSRWKSDGWRAKRSEAFGHGVVGGAALPLTNQFACPQHSSSAPGLPELLRQLTTAVLSVIQGLWKRHFTGISDHDISSSTGEETALNLIFEF